MNVFKKLKKNLFSPIQRKLFLSVTKFTWQQVCSSYARNSKIPNESLLRRVASLFSAKFGGTRSLGRE